MDARWYQVVVPRFDNGNRENDLGGDTRDGGDLEGLRRRLPYLKELGINTLYLTHVFARQGQHPHERYTFGKVDESFRDPGQKEVASPQGDSAAPDAKANAQEAAARETDARPARKAEQVLSHFLKAAHAEGFRVVLEGPCTVQPHERAGDAQLEATILEVTKKWMDPDGDGKLSDGVDGWIVQDPQQLPHDLWKRWRDAVKKINPDALLVVDVEGDIEKWLTGETFDTFVNRGLAQPIERVFSPKGENYTLEKFVADVTASCRRAAPERQRAAPIALSGPRQGRLQPIFDRMMTVAEGQPPVPMTGPGVGPPRARLARILQFFCVGAPLIYYGEEIDLPNTLGDHSLAPMRWQASPGGGPLAESPEQDLTSLIQWLAIRRGVDKPLRDGALETIHVDEERKLLVLGRIMPFDEVLLVLNLGKEKQRVVLTRGKQGNYVGFITPQLDPKERPPRMPPPKPPAGGVIPPLRIAGSRQIIDEQGQFLLWVDPRYARFALLQDNAP